MSTAAEPAKFIEITLLRGTAIREKIEVPDGLTVLQGTEEPKKGQCAIRIMDQLHGDERLVWDSNVLAEINAARHMFQQLIAKGMRAMRVGLDGKRTSEKIDEFDPTAEEIIFIPMPMVAGG